jgi:hypothetical protein
MVGPSTITNHYQPTFTDLDDHRRTTVGWEYVHIAVDDHSRLAYAEVLPDEKATTAIGFLNRALAFDRPEVPPPDLLQRAVGPASTRSRTAHISSEKCGDAATAGQAEAKKRS